MTKSGAAASPLPTSQHFEQLAFLYDKTSNLPTVSNITQATTLSANSAMLNFLSNSQTDITDASQVNQHSQFSPAVVNFSIKSPFRVSNESLRHDHLHCQQHQMTVSVRENLSLKLITVVQMPLYNSCITLKVS